MVLNKVVRGMRQAMLRSRLHRGVIAAVTVVLLVSVSGAAVGPSRSANREIASASLKTPKAQHFFSRPDLAPPALEVSTPADARVAPGSLFLTPRKGAVQQGPVIMDNRGQLMWSGARRYSQATDFRAQQYRGKPVLTFWQGTVSDGGHGAGEYVILDSSYRRVATVRTGRDQAGDLHEFQLTAHDTALVTAYKPVPADLTAVGGPRNGWVIDGVFQEIDIATGKVLYDWHSVDHIPVTDTYADTAGAGTQRNPLDYFHINSVDRTPDGDYVVSARHTHAVYRIDRMTGHPRWRLGGKNSDFTLAPGVRFNWQHDARLVDENTLSLFDNANNDPTVPPNRAPSRSVLVELDTATMTATLDREYPNPGGLVSVSQGATQLLPNGNVLTGWGSQPEISEFSPGGELLFDASFGKGVDSYRAYRFEWHAKPPTTPAMATRTGRHGGLVTAVSWNGATEVTQWRLLAGPDPEHLTEMSTVDRKGFETTVRTNPARVVQAQALDAHGDVIGATEPTTTQTP